ncbi:Uncharacterised protein [Vibrio cholerae]|uniref:Uncharacterized protein n=1 Tax=Vibrio cholerae TaxID=666 RepID=A0A656ATB6_VIBCL|nr:Uncharacterised protein [Vibrio cholerae]CSB38044.1 Uncharacterised protein [Vibrio cholerae]CSC31697.1 Uncharacterised protein [Vibrio cholerae]CSC56834.1 Uncharacterised protein [Vibrio cholerae]CSC66219.1 Uncharacterised protein [Vibrio cholerae]
MMFAIDAFNPTNPIATAGKLISSAWCKRNSRAFFNFGFKYLNPDTI